MTDTMRLDYRGILPQTDTSLKMLRQQTKHEWEKALWEQAVHSGPKQKDEPAKPAPAADAARRTAVPENPLTKITAPPDTKNTTCTKARFVPPSAFPANEPRAVTAGLAALNEPGGTVTASPAAVADGQTVPSANATAVSRRPHAASLAAPPNWPSMRMHQHQGNVTVWMRAEGAPPSLESFLQPLRDWLGAKGLTLRRLIVNGACVWEQHPATQSDNTGENTCVDKSY